MCMRALLKAICFPSSAFTELFVFTCTDNFSIHMFCSVNKPFSVQFQLMSIISRFCMHDFLLISVLLKCWPTGQSPMAISRSRLWRLAIKMNQDHDLLPQPTSLPSETVASELPGPAEQESHLTETVYLSAVCRCAQQTVQAD